MAGNITGRRIHITGVVQGVGFRPFVYSYAKDLNLTGWVRNTSAGVDIEVDGQLKNLLSFIIALNENAPPLAQIDGITIEECESNGYEKFEIIPSQRVEGAFQPLSADVSTCPDCLRELFDPNDRHYNYPFVNCTNCGPRLTIIKDIPYDRLKTTMAEFEMCPDCAEEYHDPLDRRFHAQPVACPVCGPKVWVEVDDEIHSEREEAIEETRRMLKEGKILAIKGLGGFHLACDAENSSAVAELRKRKLRVDKPFALMMTDIETVKMHCFAGKEEEELLTSRERPIVLLKRKPSSPIAKAVAPQQDTLGVMLPYTPLHYLLMNPEGEFPGALVMTSGNLSEEPIATDNQEARTRLRVLADAFLMHERDIYTRCDDSVVRINPTISTQPDSGKYLYPLRRSRGYTPNPIKLKWETTPLLAAGGELKNTFCLTRENYAFISHHIGDMENLETLQAFEDGIQHFENLFRIKPEVIAYDLHPNYMATKYALARAEEEGLPVFGVQHHHAHIASCMAENGLTGEQPVIGLAFDGTGYGEDGNIWGGEALITDYNSYQRAYQLVNVPLPGGDKAVREPCRQALAWLKRSELAWEENLPPVKFLSEKELKIINQQIEKGLNAPLTSSMGRLFDAVSSLIGVCQQVNYAAQAAIELETLVDPDETNSYPYEINQGIINPSEMIEAIVSDLHGKKPVETIAARFHNTIAEISREVCVLLREEHDLNQVVLSGGVWQNMVLLSKTVQLLSNADFNIYMHNLVPANDGGLSLGQAVIAHHRLEGRL